MSLILESSVKQQNLNSIIVEAERCVACGLCLPYCPTYLKTGSEADSPRGRIQLMRAVAQDILPNNERFKDHINLCLSCRSCESACPNNVQYGTLVDTTRAQFLSKKNLAYSVTKLIIRQRILQIGINRLLWFMQVIGIHKLVNTLLPLSKRLPQLTRTPFWKSKYPSHNTLDKKSVSLFLGCATNTLDADALKASIFVLNKLGVDVDIPKMQGCCGSIARQMGDATESKSLIANNITAFNNKQPIISAASGCGAGLQDYLPQHQIIDLSAYLLSCDWTKVSIAPLKQIILVQDPCSLRNVQGSNKAVYGLLNKIPQADIVALSGNGQCCGGAGAYMLTQPEMANALRADKLSAIKNAINGKANVIIATANIGCSIHIAAGLREQNMNVCVLHPIQIIAAQMGYALHV